MRLHNWGGAMAAAIGVALGWAAEAAVVLTPVGSPTWDSTTGNGLQYVAPSVAVNSSGLAVGYGSKWVNNTLLGGRALRWDGGGSTLSELGHLGTNNSNRTSAVAYAIDEAGRAVGYCDKYSGDTKLGTRATRWDAGGTTATELVGLGTDGTGVGYGSAAAVNANGLAVGSSRKYFGGTDIGNRAVRWSASGTAAEELGDLGTTTGTASGTTNASASAVNVGGTAVGVSDKYSGGSNRGTRAVRWDAGTTTATELGNLGTWTIIIGGGIQTDGVSHAQAYAINDAGDAVGYAAKYQSNANLGTRAVRWAAGTLAAVELDNLGTNGGQTNSTAYAINAAGVVVGTCDKYSGTANLGQRAVRWAAAGTAITELGTLGVSSSWVGAAQAVAVNEAGLAAGYSRKYVGGVSQGDRACAWAQNGVAIDLNDLNVVATPSGATWVLNYVRSMSADGWMAGEGRYDPDGAGPLSGYNRLWVAQVGLGGEWLNKTGANNTWARGANWSTGTPAIQLDANFNQAATYTVAFDRDASARTVSLAAGDVTFALGSRTLEVTTPLTVLAGAKLHSNGTIAGGMNNLGVLAPGNSPGTLQIVGDLVNSGTIEFEIASLSSFDRLNVSGNATLGGTLALILNGYGPQIGDNFDLLDFGGFAANGCAFDFTQAPLGPGLSWDTSSFTSTGTISVVPEPSTIALLAVAALAAAALGHAGRRIAAALGRRHHLL